jgi:hypothetical protein
VASHWQLVKSSFAEEKYVLGVLGKAGAEAGELVND